MGTVDLPHRAASPPRTLVPGVVSPPTVMAVSEDRASRSTSLLTTARRKLADSDYQCLPPPPRAPPPPPKQALPRVSTPLGLPAFALAGQFPSLLRARSPPWTPLNLAWSRLCSPRAAPGGTVEADSEADSVRKGEVGGSSLPKAYHKSPVFMRPFSLLPFSGTSRKASCQRFVSFRNRHVPPPTSAETP